MNFYLLLITLRVFSPCLEGWEFLCNKKKMLVVSVVCPAQQKKKPCVLCAAITNLGHQLKEELFAKQSPDELWDSGSSEEQHG